ncbi:MAG: adenylate/guanylate cyclase domain-containing protein [Thermodesulfobacteriota bacterium]|nr:adenylate/guanylate cyclase domain-containing protein [Thermodesulfobacteriota bacterium]
MDAESVYRKLTAILSADVKGYSRLMGDDEMATIETLTAYRELMSNCIRQYNGRVVDSTGDNLLAEFVSVVDAIECAVDIQKKLKSRNEKLPEARRMAFRIGVSLGDVIQDGDSIFGDGVNITARLEGLAEAGGVCISGTAYDHVKNKSVFGYEFLGKQKVKNISDPVRAYRVLTRPEDAGVLKYKVRRDDPKHRRRLRLVTFAVVVAIIAGMVSWKHQLNIKGHKPPIVRLLEKHRALKLPDKPSIAVLPFTNMSGDIDQDYFSDGMTEDLITDLSQISGLFVISRNSVFTYKGKAVKVKQVAKDLGVRYVLEGSVRRVSDRVRINAQLIDAKTGHHIWAERYDREMKHIFTLQDEVTGKIVEALAVKLVKDEQTRMTKKGTDNLGAYDLVLRGSALLNRYTRESNELAGEMFERAIQIDPGYTSAYEGLVWTRLIAWMHAWNYDPKLLDEALELGKKAVSLDESSPQGHVILGNVYLWKKRHEEAIAELKKAVFLNPNDADALSSLGEALVFSGLPKKGLGYLEKAIRLNPNYPEHYIFSLGHAFFELQMYEEAVAALQKAIIKNPNFMPAHSMLASCYGHLGKKEFARAKAEEVKRIIPQFSLKRAAEILPMKDEVFAHYAAGLRKAGFNYRAKPPAKLGRMAKAMLSI